MTLNTPQQHILSKGPALNDQYDPGNNMFKVQLPSNINQALNLESWNGNFHTISLHSSLEHFASDIKSIKKSLKRMQKYILNKSIVGDKANKVKDLKYISEVAWWFISALYKSQWNNLIVDKNSLSFRCNVNAQFNPPLSRNVVSNKSNNTDKAATVSTLLPPILAKSPKEVVEISKFFKKNSSTQEKKSYAQVLSQSINTARDTLRIKEAFLNLQNKKFKNIQKIISNENKPKPYLNMITKRLS